MSFGKVLMQDSDKTDVEELASLKQERSTLLEELETAYLQMEEHLLATGRERKVTYDQLRQKNEELQDRLKELEETHEELGKAQRMLIRSERLAAMGEMAAAIVHEIKNPLAVIIGQMSWILGPDGKAEEEGLRRVLKSGENLRDLVQNVLGFARHTHGQAGDLDLNDLISELNEFVRPLSKGVKIEMDLEADLPQVHSDPVQIEQVMMNLMLNALDVMDRKGHIQVSTRRGTISEQIESDDNAERPWCLAVDANGQVAEEYVIAEVRDNGPGIKKQDMGQVFEAFFTTKAEGEGTGLGLSIARTIVSQWGGNILLSSKEGQGASFKVFLPPADISEGKA
jgi:signal transduction histidine kinase